MSGFLPPDLSPEAASLMHKWLDHVAGDGLKAMKARQLADDARDRLHASLPFRAVLLTSVSPLALLLAGIDRIDRAEAAAT